MNTYRLNLNKNFQKAKTKDCKTAAAAAAAMTTLDRKKISEQDRSMKYPSKKRAFIPKNFIKKQVSSCRLSLHYVGDLNRFFEYLKYHMKIKMTYVNKT